MCGSRKVSYQFSYKRLSVIGLESLLNNNNNKYCSLQSTHIFCPVAIETSGTWNAMAVDLVQEIGRRITNVTEDSRETTFLFQRLSMALQQGNAVAFQNRNIVAAVKLLSFRGLQALCWWAKK